MKFTKTAAALAVAGCVAAPMAQAEVTLTGQVAIGILASDADDIDAIDEGDPLGPDENGVPQFATLEDVVDAASPSDATLFGDDAIINVKATAPLDFAGLTVTANYRTDLGLVGDVATGDNIYVGVDGDFGDLRIGEVNDALEYGQLANDIIDIGGENEGIGYEGNFGDFTVGANWSPEGSSDAFAFGGQYTIFGFLVGAGFATKGSGDGGEDSDQFTLGASWSWNGIGLAAAYKDFDFERETFSAQGTYGIGKASFGITFEGEVGDVDEDDSTLRLDVGYDVGGSTNVSARVNFFTDDDNDDNDLNDFRILFTKSF